MQAKPGAIEGWAYDTVSALACSLAQAHADASVPESRPPYNDVVRFVLGQLDRLPDYLRPAMMAATLGFDLSGCPVRRPFHTARPEMRARQLAAWKKSKLGFQRDLIRYYESLATLALYGRGAEHAAGGAGQDQSGGISQPQANESCEVAVIGSGPGGSITACLLAEAGRDVLLIEEGPFYPLESCVPFSREEMEQKYRNGGQTVALGPDKVAYVEGRCVGGGSEINSGLYHRTPPEVLDAWRKEFGVEALQNEDMEPHFEACEHDVSVSLMPGALPAASLKLDEGARRLGWKSMEVPRWFKYEAGNGSQGMRQSMTKTFTPRFLMAGGRLLPRVRVSRLRQEGGKWVLEGKHAEMGGLRIQAENVFVCGGAVQTPLLLRRSGITDNVGNSLRLHPTLKIVARFAEPVNSAKMGVPVHQVKEFAPRISFGCSISTPPYLALGLLDQPARAREVWRAWPHFANYYAMITGSGNGTVRPIPGCKDALVRFKLPSQDRRDLADGLKRLSELLFQAGAVALYPGITGLPELGSRDDLRRLPDELPRGMANLMTIHLFSSCPMGENKQRCAADSFGRVHGFKRLFIADASLLCTPPGVNPQGSVMAVARRNALRFLNA